jgi:DNA polymerase-3 subunit gamma/tau
VAKAVVAVPLPKMATPVAPVPAPVIAAPASTPKAYAPAPVVAPLPVAEPSVPKPSDRLRPKPVEPAVMAEDAMAFDGTPPDDAPPPWMEADDAPGPAAVLTREPEAPRRALLNETPEGALWAERIAALNLPGMTGELARQAQALGCASADGREAWTLRVERDSLRAPALVAKLEAALNATLHIEAGVAQDSIALRTVALAEAQQRAAEDLAQQHPMTRTLLAQFPSARILPGSVQPLITT